MTFSSTHNTPPRHGFGGRQESVGCRSTQATESSGARAELSGQGRSRAVAALRRTQASRGCAGMRASTITKSGQKEDSWFALACEQTGLLGHRCKNENTGLKARIKRRTLMLCKFCEIGIKPQNPPDTAAERCTRPHLLSSHGKSTVSAARRSLMSGANLEHCHSRSHPHINGDRVTRSVKRWHWWLRTFHQMPWMLWVRYLSAIPTAFHRAARHTP